MATNNMFLPIGPDSDTISKLLKGGNTSGQAGLDSATLANFIKGGNTSGQSSDTSGQGIGLFDMSSPGWNNILMGLALMDAGRYHQQPQPLMDTLAPFMKMNAQEANQKRALAFAGDALKNAPSMAGMGDAPVNPASAAPSSAPGGMFAPTLDGSGKIPSDGGSRISDPRGVAPLIYASAQKYGIDPNTAVKVAQSEGLGTFYGDGGKSGGAFQLYTGGGLGNDFQKDTGLDPLDPKNEPATIDYALSHAAQNGWGAFHGAKRVGVGQWDGINIDRNNLPGVPNFSGGMAGNQGQVYAPLRAPGPPNMQFAQATPQTMTDAGSAQSQSQAAQSPLLVGDSLAGHMITFGGGTGATDRASVGKYKPGLTAVNGFTPSQILDTVIPGIPDDQVRGRNVVLSTGASNDPGQLNVIPQQIAALKQRGASGVTLVGVGTAPQLQGVNGSLAQIAQQNGAIFAGPLRNVGGDGIHSADPRAELAGVQAAMPPQAQMQPNSFAASPQSGAPPASPQFPAPGQSPSPQQMMQARVAMPQMPPPPSPTDVSGLATQRATAIRSVDYWTRAMVAAGFLGDQGKGLMEAAKAKIDLAGKFLTAEQQKQLDLKYAGPLAVIKNQAEYYGPGANVNLQGQLAGAKATAEAQAAYGKPDFNTSLQGQLAGAKSQGEIGAQLGMAGYTPGTPDAQMAARNMLANHQPEAQRNAGFAYPNNPAMQQQVVAGSIADNRPEAVKLAGAANLQGPERNQIIAGAIGGNAPTGEQKDYAAYVADQQARGGPVQGFGEWYLDSKKAGAANVQQKVEGQGQAALVKAGVDALQQTHEAELAANKRTQLYGQMAQAMSGFTPGATAEMRLKGTSILRDLGIIQGDNVPPQEMFNQAARQIQVHVQPKGQGQVSNYERELFAQAVPNMTKSPEMLSQAIGIAKRLDDYDRQIAQIHRDVARDNNGLPNIVEAQNRIAALGPPLSASEQTALQALGQNNQGGNAAAVPGGPASTQPGNLIYDPKTRTLQPAR